MQTKEQQRKLSLYGQVIVGIDATYKTTQWCARLQLLLLSECAVLCHVHTECIYNTLDP